MNLFDMLMAALHSYGYLGTFLLGVIGNAVPFLPIPYLVPVFILSGFLNPLLVGISVGIGSALGKCVDYWIGRGGASVLGKERQRGLQCFSSLLGKYGAIAVFIFAATPLPDDIIMIPMGIAKYNFAKFFIALLSGKLVLGLVVAYAAKYSMAFLSIFIGEGNIWVVTALSIAFMLLILYIVLKINWVEAAEIISAQGTKAYMKILLKRTFKWRKRAEKGKGAETTVTNK